MAFDFGNANDQQKEAIQTTEGPLLIIAGPGTGKTFTLVKRIVYLITERGIQPEEIMVATFTEKAAKELITRITNELYKMGVQVNLNEMYVGTFHSIFRTTEELASGVGKNNVTIKTAVNTHSHGIYLLHSVDEIKKVTGLQSQKVKNILRRMFSKGKKTKYKFVALENSDF